MNEEELKRYYSTYTECWKLFRKHSNPVDTEEFWDSLIGEANLIYEKEKTVFRKNMIVETLNEIERVWKSRKK